MASNTSDPLDLVEAQGSHLRETTKCLPRRLALLGHLLSLGKAACSSCQEHTVFAANSLLLGRFYLPSFCDPKDLVLALGYSSTKDDTDLLGLTWLQNTPEGTILTRHRKGVLRVDYPNQTPKGHDTRGTKKPSQGQKTSVSLRPSQTPRQGTEGSITSPHVFAPQLYLLLPDDGVICSDTFCLGGIPQNWETPSCTNCSLKVWLLW